MLVTSGFLIYVPTLDRLDSTRTAAARASSHSSADGCLPTCSFPSPTLLSPVPVRASELSVSLLSSPPVPQMQVCAVVGVSTCADEHTCVFARAGEGRAHICVSVCMCVSLSGCGGYVSVGRQPSPHPVFLRWMDAIHTHPHTHTHVVTCVAG